jgi:hypothetical protein
MYAKDSVCISRFLVFHKDLLAWLQVESCRLQVLKIATLQLSTCNPWLALFRQLPFLIVRVNQTRRAPKPARLGSRVSLPVALRLFVLMLSPKSGKALRERCRMLFRREGLAGLARRLHGPRG